MRYYVHGAGRSGKQAWPAQNREEATFADHGRANRMAEKAQIVADQAPAAPYSVITHSLGAVATILALRDHQLRPTSLVLVEPALYDVARGHAAIEAHIEPMTRAFDKAACGELFGYWQIVKPVMFGEAATLDTWRQDRQVAARMAGLEAPWGHAIDPSFVRSVPTLVVTGGWNQQYQAIAEVLRGHGARSIALVGQGHRVQDHPHFPHTLSEFLLDQSA